FLVITPSVTDHQTRWALRRAAAGSNASVFNATSNAVTLHIAGPRSAELLQRLTPFDVSSLRRFRAADMDIAEAVGTVMRLSFTGEDGYEIYVRPDFAVNVYDAIVDAGEDLGLRHAGMYALDSLRSEV